MSPLRAAAGRLLGRLRAPDARHLFGNASSIFGTTIITSGLGAVYWAIASRSFSPNAVGVTAAAVSAMSLLARIANLGMPTMLVGELHRFPGRERSLVSEAITVTGVVGFVLGAGFAIVAVVTGNLGGSAALPVLFAVGVASTSSGFVLDSGFIGILRGYLQFARNSVASVAKLVVLVLLVLVVSPGDRNELEIYAATVIGTLLSLALVARFPKGSRGPSERVFSTLSTQLGRLALRHYIVNLAVLAPGLLLPIVVTAVVSPEANAYFYIAFTTAGFVFAVPVALVTALFAVGSRKGMDFKQTFRLSFATSLAVCAVSGAVLFLIAEPLMGLFGPQYAERAAPVLRIFMLGSVPVIANSHYISIARIERRFARAALVLAAGNAVEIASVAVGGHLAGLDGAMWGWLFGMWISIVPVLPAVIRALRGKTRTPTAGDDAELGMAPEESESFRRVEADL